MSKKTIKALQRLEKIKDLDLMEKRRALSEMQAELQALHNQVKDIHERRTIEIAAAQHDTAKATSLPLYLDGLQHKLQDLKTKIYQLADFMIPVQESVREAFREVKSLETATKNMLNDMKVATDKAEQIQLDEISLNKRQDHV